ncbi:MULTISPECIES: TrkA family potassium uptake protein [Cyanophyceae]|uniref:potassium channel family protein n=1 Tax=Cyanophyceae TaxID=3028117 RepID=UPI00016DCA94|nr:MULTISPECIES: TrkA family potassium uptake protein [Cyanophyceae]ACB00246.1 TrkA-N domain family [Picosynechococcus sp. PCC 7002]AMA10574.1 potassium transporter [Picosynechococcus sp. PCC 73109]ANV88019.1 potassium transporter [Picosynechococcus sp. PCC 7117]QCS50736.1 TrkA family potassium uptake protein [Picosynechococcus sp. PCC 11901]SMH52787.1 trk system potassium uptake protein TrkA [Picosynechococcus sp. OG1]
MNLRNWNFLFQGFRQEESRQFAVIGLGRFGRAVCTKLHNMGYEVLGTDINPKLVAQVVSEKLVSHAMQLDSTEVMALRQAGIFEFDTVIVAIGNYLQESIVTTLNVKEGGVEHVVAKASSEVHGKLLKRVGADRIVYPEYEAGAALAMTLTKPSILDRFDIDEEHSIVEIKIPEAFHDKTLAELSLRANYGVNVLAVGNEEHFEINPGPEHRLDKSLMMMVIGTNDAIHRLPLS